MDSAAESQKDRPHCSWQAAYTVRRTDVNVAYMPFDVSDETADQLCPLLSTLAIAVMVFQLRVVTGTPKSRSRVPR